MPPAQIALAWMLAKPFVTAPIIGATKLGHLEDAISALELVLDDENRYVRGDALHALERIGTPAAKAVLIRHLVPARWWQLTSPESTF